ncbi:uncharacterized protein LOC144702973 [Wolffia australiana]
MAEQIAYRRSTGSANVRTFLAASRTVENVQPHSLGGMSATCASCQSKMWMQERKHGSGQRNPVFQLCCKNGEVMLSAFPNPLAPLLALLEGTIEEAKHYRNFLRAYNSAFGFTSSGANFDRTLADNHAGIYTYRIQGGVYHHISNTLLPPIGQAPCFAQIYMYDTDYQIERRISIFPDLHRCILEKIHHCLREANPFQDNNEEVLHSASTQEFELRIGEPSIPDRRYDQPIASEVAILMPGDGNEGDGRRNIILRKCGGGLQFVNQLDGNYDPLHFVLLFPYGTQEWSMQLKERSKNMLWMLTPRLKSLAYSGFNATRGYCVQASTTGRMIILPPSFTGGPRYMQGLYQDAMAIELLHLIIDKEIFDNVKGRVYVVEFQKRGLPHAHMLWILDDPYKPRTPEDIDKIVCAELPDPSETELLNCVATHMIHGPCGSANPRSPCMKNEKCSKKYPKEFINSTQYLCKVFNCHINVEICSSIQSVKYLYKYVYKGHDRIQAKLSSKVPPMNNATKMYPTVYALQVHDENMQAVVYEEGEPVSEVMDRLNFMCPRDTTRYYLRLMLHRVPGARCYEDLRTVYNVAYDTCQSAAEALGLLHSDAEFDNNLALASAIASPRQIRELFAMILLYCELSQPDVLFEKYLDAMSDDIRLENCATQVTNHIRQKVLRALHSILYHNGSSLAAYQVLPQVVEPEVVDERSSPSHGNNIQNAMITVEHLRYMLNVEQRQLYDAVFDAIETTHHAKEPRVFFVDGPGGSGKTFLYSAILAQIKASRLTAIPTATSGIVALLLEGARTLHSTFNIPIPVTHISTCGISPDSVMGQQIQSASIIIVDKAPMMHRHVYETLDRSIRDVMKTIDATLENVPFGGKVVVMGGDFRQVLPVIQKGSRSMIISSSLNRSNVWRHCSVFRLRTNVRVSPEQQVWSEFLLAVGEGRLGPNVHLPAELQRVPSLLDLIARVLWNL